MAVHCNLSEIRRRRGIAAAQLAQSIGVQRQTIYAIEAGSYVPNTSVALHLARVLEVSVEELFRLPEGESPTLEQLEATVVSNTATAPESPVRLVRMDDQWLAFPTEATPSFLSDADGLVAVRPSRTGSTQIRIAEAADSADDCLIIAGCDPALGLLAREVEREARQTVLPVSATSKEALQWLHRGWVHVAGCHLKESRSAEFNLPTLRKVFGEEELVVVTFAEWEAGFVTAPGNPLGLKETGDLANPAVVMMNRESGSGSRSLLDSCLRKAGLHARQLKGYDSIAAGHLAAVRAVSEGRANCCVATSSASRAFHLDFIPIRRERFDLVLRKQSVEIPGVRALLEVLQRRSLRRKLEVLAGYDVTQTGSLRLH